MESSCGLDPKGCRERLRMGIDIALDHLESQMGGKGIVGKRKDPDSLSSEWALENDTFHLKDQQPSCDWDVLFNACKSIMDANPRSGHPMFFNQLYGKPDEVGILADWLVVASNAHVHTYEAAPAFVVLEKEVLSKLARVFGGKYLQDHDGLFVPGGSMGNFYGLLLARHWACPTIRRDGFHGCPSLVAFTSEQSHYSYSKASSVLGLGSKNMIAVACDETGSMIPAELEKAILLAKEEGKRPFFVGTTAGTTVTGAYDPFVSISELCKKYDMWMHVDGVWGGPVLLSRRHRHLMNGAERADSLAWCAHKLLGAPTQCAVFLTSHSDQLLSCNASAASYLFQPEKCGASSDPGDKTFMCGRRADMFKLWLMWKHLGDVGMEQRVDQTLELADSFEKLIESSSGKFELVQRRSFANVCFWFIPPSMRPFHRDLASKDELKRLGETTMLVKGRMHESGDAMINYQSVNGLPNFFRIVFRSHSSLSVDDLRQMLERMDFCGKDL